METARPHVVRQLLHVAPQLLWEHRRQELLQFLSAELPRRQESPWFVPLRPGLSDRLLQEHPARARSNPESLPWLGPTLLEKYKNGFPGFCPRPVWKGPAARALSKSLVPAGLPPALPAPPESPGKTALQAQEPRLLPAQPQSSLPTRWRCQSQQLQAQPRVE